TDGKEEGVEAYQVKNGAGLNFTVVASRAMDISSADWCGRSLAWISSTGETAPEFYEEPGLGWLRSFYGGLLVTCGLTQVGAPNIDQGTPLGLHGRISNTPAYQVSYDSKWEGDDYIMWVQGKVRETAVFGENILLTRKITTKLGDNRIWISDTVENQGFDSVPHMILYHFNTGFPLVSEDSELVSPTLSVSPRDPGSEVDIEHYYKFEPPTKGFTERVYYHNMAAEPDGTVIASLINRKIPGGFGIYIQYSKNELPFFTEWKMNGQGTYVVGLEPANCHPEGRAREREMGTLQFLEPGEVRKYNLEVGVLTSNEAILELQDRIEKAKRSEAA
ncbi:MAG TPA: aldose 1-epimerase family protein, partial [Armatimonadota bacterium]|nr:aldose 1-epimerase family protein [Armatimonadota bacterium]